jgi:hypothetical protein
MRIRNTIRVSGDPVAAMRHLHALRLFEPAGREKRRKVIGTTNQAVLAGMLLAFSIPALADQCPGSNTCPTGQFAQAEGPKLVQLSWIDPEERPAIGYVVSGYNLTTKQSLTQQWSHSTGDGMNPVLLWAQPLVASTTYQFTICAEPNHACITTNQVTTLPQPAGSDTPAPVITNVVSSINSITISWESTKSYAYYHTLLDVGNPPQSGDFGGGYVGSYTFGPTEFLLQPGTTYQVKVQGCLGWNYCSPWTVVPVKTTSLPPPPAVAPQNLHTTSNSCCEIDVLWTNPPGVTGWDAIRTPDFTSTTVNDATDFRDLWVVPGRTYTYQVCLHYQSGKACASTTGSTQPGAPPPPAQLQTCQLSFTCQNKPIGGPPDYTLQCPARADFYEQSPLTGALTLLGSDTKWSGASSDYNDIIRACVPGESFCSQYSVYRGRQDWCPDPGPGGGGGGCGGQKGPCGKCPGGTCQ